MTTGLSASGARIRGDDYQHLFVWIQVLRALQVGSGIVEIGIEDPEAGNADDVTVYAEGQRREFYQVKASVDAREPMGLEWLLETSRAGGPSMIQKFYGLWAEASSHDRPRLALVTNRLLAPGDPLLSLRDGRDGTVARALRVAGPGSKGGTVRKRLADHLHVCQEEVLLFLEDISFRLGKTNDDWIEMAMPHMFAAGLRHDEDAVSLGMSIVRGWVTGGKRRISREDLERAVEPLKRPGTLPAASLLVQAIDRDLMPETATTVLDWTDKFPGGEPRVRRLPSSRALWNGRFRPDMRSAARDMRSLGHANVLVRGYMRLPTWFAVGVEFGRTAGFQVTSFQGKVPWSSEGEWSDIALEESITPIGRGKDLAVGVSLSFDLSTDVLTYLDDQQIEVDKYVCYRPRSGASNRSIHNGAEGRHWAYEIRDSVRRLVQRYRPGRVHLFLSGPHGAVLLLGHVWDRIPDTQLYEDLGATQGYSPSYLIPN